MPPLNIDFFLPQLYIYRPIGLGLFHRKCALSTYLFCQISSSIYFKSKWIFCFYMTSVMQWNKWKKYLQFIFPLFSRIIAICGARCHSCYPNIMHMNINYMFLYSLQCLSHCDDYINNNSTVILIFRWHYIYVYNKAKIAGTCTIFLH